MGEKYASGTDRRDTRFAGGPEPGLGAGTAPDMGAATEIHSAGARGVSADFSINARVMQILARRWVDMSAVEVGTTEGVVLIQGRLEREPRGWGENDELARERFLLGVRSAIRNIPGVVDVVMRSHAVGDREAPWAENVS